MYVLLYLVAIVFANLAVVAFGPGVTIINAFLLIGLDLTTRDRLHEAWQGRRLALRMALLIAAGSVLSWAFNRDAGPIALASFLAFTAAASVDSLVYYLLRDRPWWQKVNGSNIVSALVDSLVFPTVAFGGFLPVVVLGQFLAKTAGGALWSVILAEVRYPLGRQV